MDVRAFLALIGLPWAEVSETWNGKRTLSGWWRGKTLTRPLVDCAFSEGAEKFRARVPFGRVGKWVWKVDISAAV